MECTPALMKYEPEVVLRAMHRPPAVYMTKSGDPEITVLPLICHIIQSNRHHVVRHIQSAVVIDEPPSLSVQGPARKWSIVCRCGPNNGRVRCNSHRFRQMYQLVKQTVGVRVQIPQ